MDILKSILTSLQGDAPVRSVLVGAHWVVVCSRHCGMAAAIGSDAPHGRTHVREAGRLERKSARELAEYAADWLPQADVIAITASALINHTLDRLLSLCNADAAVMILGPSTPLTRILFDHGATILCGARVFDEAAVLRTVRQGASFRQVGGVKLLTLTHEKGEE